MHTQDPASNMNYCHVISLLQLAFFLMISAKAIQHFSFLKCAKLSSKKKKKKTWASRLFQCYGCFLVVHLCSPLLFVGLR